MHIRVALSEGEIARDFFNALRRKKLPEKFFYWFPLSVHAWLRLSTSRRYGNFSRSLELVKRHASFLARRVASRRIQWIALGPGEGTKEFFLLRSFLRERKTLRYFPVEYSQALLERAVAQAGCLGIPTLGVKADIENPCYWDEISPRLKGEARIASLLGNTLGNFESGDFLDILAHAMRGGDWVLADGELFRSEKEVMVRYDHPANRRFALAPLLSIGLRENDGVLHFRFEKTRAPGVYRLSKFFVFRRHRDIAHGNGRISFSKGTILRMSPSYKYDPQGMRRVLERGRAFRVDQFFKDAGGRMGLWVARRT